MGNFNQPTSIKIPAKPEYVGIARLITAAFAGFLGFDSDTVEDIKIAISEACTNAILQLSKENPHEQDKGIEVLTYLNNDSMFIDVKYSARHISSSGGKHASLDEDDLGMSILTSIMDKVEVVGTDDGSAILRLVKRAPKV